MPTLPIGFLIKVDGHYAINSVPEAWDRIEQNNHWYKGAKNTLGQYYYHSPETLRRMFERCGLRVFEMMQEWAYCTMTFEKPKIDIVPTLEGLLWELLSADSDDVAARERCCEALEALPGRLADSIRPFIDDIRDGKDLYARADPILLLRRAWRGL